LRRPFDGTSALVVEETVQVMVFTNPLCWDTCHVSNWFDGLKAEERIREIVMQHLNFVPCGLLGRVVGVTDCDRLALRRISQRMDRDDLVGTLGGIIRNHCRDNNSSSSPFILRVIGFTQAQRRVAISPFLAERFEVEAKASVDLPPLNSLKKEKMKDLPQYSDEDSLFCSWEYDVSVEQETHQRDQDRRDLNALKKCFRQYKRMQNPFESEHGDRNGW
jgi:hypothetical protein